VTDHCPDGALLLALAEGRAAPDDARRLREHTTECPACAAEMLALGRLVAALRSASTVDGRIEDAARTGCTGGDGSCGHGYDAGAFLDGALDPAERLAFERHATHCAICRDELSGLMTARRNDAPLGNDDVVAATLAKLRSERSRVLFRLADGALRFVGGSIESAANFAALTGFDARQPALAGVRSDEAPVTLHWESDGGYSFDCEVTGCSSGSELIGRVLHDDQPALDMSVALRGASVSHGPESVDLDGRFGPWHLEPGTSELRFEALRLPDGRLTITIDIEHDAGTREDEDRLGA